MRRDLLSTANETAKGLCTLAALASTAEELAEAAADLAAVADCFDGRDEGDDAVIYKLTSCEAERSITVGMVRGLRAALSAFRKATGGDHE